MGYESTIIIARSTNSITPTEFGNKKFAWFVASFRLGMNKSIRDLFTEETNHVIYDPLAVSKEVLRDGYGERLKEIKAEDFLRSLESIHFTREYEWYVCPIQTYLRMLLRETSYADKCIVLHYGS